MSGVGDAGLLEGHGRRRRGECPCILCLPYPNAEAAEKWNAKSRAAGWADIGDPIPEGWTFTPGWGLACTEEWLP
jgi:hypothetical protein